jgi:GNAT superfamily N-acetyltransferase
MSHSAPREGVIRRVLATERQDFRDHLLRLGRESRRTRFGGSVSDAYVAAHAQRVFEGDALVYGWFLDGIIRAAAELHPIGHRLKATAEAAFSVEEPWQDGGVGSALLGRIMRSARNRGISRLVLSCLPENVRMQRIANKHGARLEWQEGDVIGSINPPLPTPLSMWRELLDESHGFLTVLFDPLRPSRPLEAAE